MSGNIGTAYIQIAPNMSGMQGKITGGLAGTGSAFAQQFGGEVSGKSAVIIGALAGVAQAATQKAMEIVTSSISNAISRVDTLNNSARTFANMGFTAGDAKVAMDALNKSILGLPTSLDAGVTGVTKIAASINDLPKAQKVFTALNDAIIGFGGNSDMVSNAVTQLSQDLGTGRITAQTWLSLTNSGLTPALAAMGRQMGITTKELKAGLSDGSIGVDTFMNSLLTLDTEGGGGMKSFRTIALDATAGIGTGFANAQTAVTRGIAKIIEAVGSKRIAESIAAIGKGFEMTLGYVATQIIPRVIASITSFVNFVVKNKDVFMSLAVGIGAAVVSLVAYNAYVKVSTALTAAYTAVSSYLSLVQSLQAQGLGGLRAAWMALNIAMNANVIGIIVTALVALTAGLVYFFTQTDLGKKVFASFMTFMGSVWSGLMSGMQTIGTFFASVWNNAKLAVDAVAAAFGVAYTAVTNFINAGINVLNGALQATIGWINQNSQLLINLGIVIGTLLLPKMVQLGIEAAKAAAQWVAATAQMVASAIASGASATASFVKTSIAATVNAAKMTAAFVLAAAQQAAAFVKSIPSIIAGFVQMSAAAVVAAAKSVAAQTVAAAQTLAGWVVSFAGYLAGIAASAAATLVAGAQMAAAWLLAMGPIGLIVALVAGAIALIIANWSTVKVWMAAFWGWLQGAAAAVWGAIQAGLSAVGGFFTTIWTGIQTAIGLVITWITQNWQLLLAILTGPIGLAVWFITKNFDTIKGVFVGAWNYITGIWGQVSGFFGGIFNNIVNAFSGIKDVGVNLVKGLWNGISDTVGWVTSKIQGFGKGILDGIKNFFGIHSPSTEFAWVGKMNVLGLAEGFDKNAGIVKKSVSNMAADALGAIGTVNGALASGFNSSLSVSSNIQSGSYETSPKVVQYNTIQQVAQDIDIKKMSSDMGFAVAMA